MSTRGTEDARPKANRSTGFTETSFRIGRLAELSGVPPVVIRAWERRHGLLEPERTENGYRLYTLRDLSVLKRVQELLGEGQRIGDIARMGRDVLAPERKIAGPAPVLSDGEVEQRLGDAWSILEALPCAVIVTDTRGLARYVNRGVLSLCGYDLADLHGRTPGSVLQGPATDRNTVARLRAAVADCRSCSVSIVNYHRSGEPYLALVDVAPLGFGANHIGFVGVARRIDVSDVSALSRAVKQVR